MVYAFDHCELDIPRFELRRDGQVRPMEPQVFDVLVVLIRERHRVVSKQELLDRVWGHRFVGDSALTSRIKSVRHVVGDDGTAQQIVRTVRGRGYQFIADVTERTHRVAASGRRPVGYGKRRSLRRRSNMRASRASTSAHPGGAVLLRQRHPLPRG
jgi:DNA-binding winged helix-turn-helix (wHTH) protein